MTGFLGDGAAGALPIGRGLDTPEAEMLSGSEAKASERPAISVSVSSQFVEFRTRILIACAAGLLLVFFGVIFYLRQFATAGSPETYLYLEAGGTLISFCYAANALVRFRGTHDRTALIL
jgi:hypothetical protein